MGSRSLDLALETLKEGISLGTMLAVAERKIKGLTVLQSDPAICTPAYESDKQGNMYLDLMGTVGLFGPPSDYSSRIFREILEHTGMQPAAMVAGDKMVCKMASRTIRPASLIQVGTEAAYLAHQDIGLLPGMGLAGPVADCGGNERFRKIGELPWLKMGKPQPCSASGGHCCGTRRTVIPNSEENCSNTLESV
jgi:DNA polymerase-4